MRKKKVDKKIEPKEKKSRAKYKLLPELEKLIYQANLVPIGIITPDYEPEVRIELQRLRVETGNPSPEFSAFDFLTDGIKHLPKEFLDYLERTAYDRVFPFGENNAPGVDMRYRSEFIKQYVEYCFMRDSMLWLVQRIETERRMMRDAEKRHGLKKGQITFEVFTDLGWDALPIFIKTALKRGADGKLHITGLAALIGEFDDSRLRRCEICNRIFWAQYKNSFTCSKPCLNALRQRRHRKTNADAINEKRRANYRRNKKLKEIKEKKNGTL